ncbi:unnamed protein product [Pleuronectes platessa]|uniref:Uncharacterized protein n=1 Tax=Pleuronectes platessa TaxID=8262 RepID=A0A9N7Y6Q2_PLEPL|nr:unnamed protein product [Pleuronectes platessa]
MSLGEAESGCILRRTQSAKAEQRGDVSLLTIPCPVSPSSSCLHFPPSFYTKGREIAGMQQPLAAGTTTTTSAPAPGHIDSSKFKTSSCLSGWPAPSEPPSLTELLGRTNMLNTQSDNNKPFLPLSLSCLPPPPGCCLCTKSACLSTPQRQQLQTLACRCWTSTQ